MEAKPRRIKSITWTHNGEIVVCTVGEPSRREIPTINRRTGRRDYSGPVTERVDSGTITSIVDDDGPVYFVHYSGSTNGRWENPFVAGKQDARVTFFGDGDDDS